MNEKEAYTGMCDKKMLPPKEGRVAVSFDYFEGNLELLQWKKCFRRAYIAQMPYFVRETKLLQYG